MSSENPVNHNAGEESSEPTPDEKKKVGDETPDISQLTKQNKVLLLPAPQHDAELTQNHPNNTASEVNTGYSPPLTQPKAEDPSPTSELVASNIATQVKLGEIQKLTQEIKTDVTQSGSLLTDAKNSTSKTIAPQAPVQPSVEASVNPKTPQTVWEKLKSVSALAWATFGVIFTLLSFGTWLVLELPQAQKLVFPQTPTPTPLPIAIAKPDEVLVIVCDFVDQDNRTVEAFIYAGLDKRVTESKLENVRIERLEAVAPRSSSEAILIGETYSATIVIWGIVDAKVIAPTYEIIRKRDVVLTKASLGPIVNVDEKSFNIYIARDAAMELEYAFLLSLGQIAYTANNYQTAIDLYNQASRLKIEKSRYFELGFSKLYLLRGQAYQKLNNPNQAFENFNEAIKLGTNDISAYTYRGAFYIDQKEYDDAFKDFDQAVKLSGDTDSIVYVNRGVVYELLNKPTEALADYEKALELDPTNANAYKGRGEIYSDIGKFKEAIEDFNVAIRLSPENSFLYLSRANAYLNMGNSQRAIANYKKALQLNSNLASDYYNGLGLVSLDNKDFDQALKYFEKAFQLRDTNANATYNLGLTYTKKGNINAALEYYTKAIDLNPDFLSAYNNRGLIYINQNKPDLAVIDLREAIRIDPKFAGTYYNLGIAYLMLDDLTNGLQNIKTAGNLRPNDGSFLNNLGFTLYQFGLPIFAVSYYSQAIEVDKTQNVFYKNRGNAYLDFKNYEAAIKDFTQAIALDENDASAYWGRGLTYKFTNEKEKAIADFNSVLSLTLDEELRTSAEQQIAELGEK